MTAKTPKKTASLSGKEPVLSNQGRQTQTILDSLPYKIMVVNNDMTVVMVNQTFLRELNLSYEDALGKNCYEVRYNLDRPCHKCSKTCFLQEVKKKGETVSSIQEFGDKNGKVRFEVTTASPILDNQGNIAQVLEASRDVTDRIGLEREAQKTNIFLQNVIQSTVDGIVVVDKQGFVLIFNKGMERLTGYSAKEIMENKIHLSKFYDIELARENMKKMRSSEYGSLGKLNPTSMSITTKDGKEVSVTLSASIITINGKEVGSVGVFTDMREILKMRKDLEDAHLQLVESEKIASLGRMAAGVAHEINNPLSGILLYAELLKESLKDDPDRLNDVQVIIEQTLRSKKIVSELLEFSRQSIGRISSFSLEHVINRCLNLLVNQATFQDIQVTMGIQSDIPEMTGDMGQLQQVFANLFINAAEAMEEKGKLHIKVDYDPKHSKFTIKISDNGPGIPKDLREKVFDIFFTSKPAGKGTGLGLSITQNIIKQHGGNITFDCPPEGGTTFIIELPREPVEPFVSEEPVFVE